jgi:hypothetical protein
MKTLYPLIGEPLSYGASQSIITTSPLTCVVGGLGASGLFAAKI